MTKNKAWKRVTAAVLALMLVSGTVPVQPIAELINEYTAVVAYADETETLLTTLTFGGSSTYSETTSGVVNVTATNVTAYDAAYGWLWLAGEGSLSVTAKEGYTITKCVFIQNDKTPITDTEAPFEIHSDGWGSITEDTKQAMDGVTSIKVYGYATPAVDTTSVYTKDSEGIADGIILKPGESIDTAGTSGMLVFDSDTSVDYSDDGDVSVRDSGEEWGSVTVFKLDENGKFYCTNFGVNSLFVPGELKSFKVSYDSADNIWHIGQIGFSLIDSSDAVKAEDLPEIAPDDAKAWVKAHIAEIKAADPNYLDFYTFTFKYNGNYYFTAVSSVEFNDNDFEESWDYGLVSFESVEEIIHDVNYALNSKYKVFLWQGESASQSEEQNDPVSYMTWDDTEKKLVEQTGDNACKEYTEVTAETTAFEDGKWYVVNADTTISSRITVTGTANLILADGKTLTASKGIEVSAGNTLNIYAQSEGDTAGKLFASADEYNAGIGSSDKINSGTVTINGGNVTVNGSYKSAGIGGGRYGAGGTVTINGGTVTANGGQQGAGIGSGTGYKAPEMPSAGTVTIYNGTVTATGGKYGAGIGGGSDAQGGTVIIYDGTVNAYGGLGGSGIGGGADANGGDVTIHGGTVTAYGGDGYVSGAMGIGKGENFQNNGSLTVADTHGVFGGESAEPTDIQTDYASTRWMYMIVKEVPHSHDFSYSADGATITATCNGKGTGDCDITDGLTLTINAPTGDLTYDGTAKEATLSTVYLGEVFSGYNGTVFPGTHTIEYYKGETKLDGAPVNAGNYTAKVTVGGATASVDYTIAKATLTESDYTAPEAKSGLTYNGSAQKLLTAGAIDAAKGTMEYGTKASPVERDTNDIYDPVVGDVIKPSGWYGVCFPTDWSVKIGDNTYAAWSESKIYLYISDGDHRVTGTDYQTAIMAAWGDNDAFRVTAVDPDNKTVTIEFIDSANAAVWSTEVPEETDAGTYDVMWRIKGADGYNDVEAQTITATIAKADITPTVSISDWTYGETASTPTVTGNTGNGTVSYQYAVKGSTTFSDGVPTDAGDYTVKATVAETKNYNGKTVTADFKISKADITPTVSISDWTYGKTASTPSVTGNSGNGTVSYQYAVKGSDEFSDGVPTDAGDYTVKATVAETKNYNGKTVTADFKINKAAITITADDKSSKYKSDIAPLTYQVSGDYVGGDELNVEISTTATNTSPVGEYDISASYNNDNYDATLVKGKYTITKADLTTSATGYSGIYDGEAHSISIDVGDSDAVVYYGTEELTTENYKTAGSTENPAYTNAGEYTVYYFVETPNYDPQPVSGSKTVVIEKADAKFTAPTANKLTYNGKEQALITEGKVEGGTFVYALGEDAENSPAGRNAVSEVPTGTDAGTYYVWYKVLGDENHNDTEPVCVTVKINQLSIKKAKVMVRNKTYTGKALKPGSKVVVNGKRLKKGTDYTITYKNNKNVGVGKAVIKGIGNYTGKVTTEFNIRPKKAAIKSVSSPKAKQLKVTWKKTPQATGYNIKVSTSKDFKTKNLVRNAFVKNNSTFSKTFAPLKSGKTYYVKIRAYKQTKSGKIYGQYSAVKEIKVK